MVLAEVLVEKSNIKKKIKQLEEYLKNSVDLSYDHIDIIISMMVDLSDKYRSHLLLINKFNNTTEVSIGGSVLSLANAIIILRTMEYKINLLNSLVSSKNNKLDIADLLKRRDKLLDEYTTMSNTIKFTEWRTEVD
jgi:hypothetical protein